MGLQLAKKVVWFALLGCTTLLACALAYYFGLEAGRTGRAVELQSVSVSTVGNAAFPEAETSPTAGFQRDEALRQQFQVFWDAWEVVADGFYGELPAPQERMYGAIKGMVASLGDEHSTFLTPREAAVLSSDDTGRFEGIGATVRIDEKLRQPRIAELVAGQPAVRAGLAVGDVIVAVDGASTGGLSVLDVVSMIRGPQGSVVRLTVRRDAVDTPEPFVVTVTRAEIELPVITTEMLDGGIAYLRLAEFNSIAPQKLRAGLESLLAQQPRGLILDLRGNPGGYLHISVEVASEFVGTGRIASEKTKDGAETIFEAKPGGLATAPSLPLAVLIDGGSASAAEIVAAAVRDSGRGVLIGETSFGKSSVQIARDMSDGSQVHVTVARWFSPDGYSIEDGLTPDIEVDMAAGDVAAGRDPQRDRAVQYLLEAR